MNLKLFSIVIGFGLMIASCDSMSDCAVAQYGSYVLTKSDVMKMLPDDMPSEDSIAYVNQVIEQWAKDKVLLNNSKEILSQEELYLIELKVARYKEDITSSFIEDKLTQNLNDSISESEIIAYHKQYRESFELKEDYLHYRYLIVPQDSVSAYTNLMRNKDFETLKNKLEHYNYAHYLDDDQWISKVKFIESNVFPDALKSKNLNTKNQIFTVPEGGSVFVFELIDYKKRTDSAPLPIVKDMIKSVLINKRKLNLLSQKKKELYNKALQNDEIKTN